MFHFRLNLPTVTSLLRCLCLFPALALPLKAFSGGPEVGRPLSSIDVHVLNTGANLQVGEHAGPVTIINLWATWCEPCREEMPALQAYYEKHRAEGLRVIAISMDEPSRIEQVRAVAAQYSFIVGTKADSNLKGLGRIWRLPSTFVLDRDGVVRKNGNEGEAKVDLDLLEKVVTPWLVSP